MTVMAATAWPSNAELIEDVARLGYLRETDFILDPTYGQGVWWKKWEPIDGLLFVSDKDMGPDHVDFTDLPWPDDAFDAVTFDPPYVCKGGRATSGILAMDERYGLVDAPKSPEQLQQLINAGLRECHRVVRPKGYVLVKVQDYVSSGKVWWGTDATCKVAVEELGMEKVDRFDMVGRVRPQPGGRRQVHARRNASTLFVFRKR